MASYDVKDPTSIAQADADYNELHQYLINSYQTDLKTAGDNPNDKVAAAKAVADRQQYKDLENSQKKIGSAATMYVTGTYSENRSVFLHLSSTAGNPAVKQFFSDLDSKEKKDGQSDASKAMQASFEAKIKAHPNFIFRLEQALNDKNHPGFAADFTDKILNHPDLISTRLDKLFTNDIVATVMAPDVKQQQIISTAVPVPATVTPVTPTPAVPVSVVSNASAAAPTVVSPPSTPAAPAPPTSSSVTPPVVAASTPQTTPAIDPDAAPVSTQSKDPQTLAAEDSLRILDSLGRGNDGTDLDGYKEFVENRLGLKTDKEGKPYIDMSNDAKYHDLRSALGVYNIAPTGNIAQSSAQSGQSSSANNSSESIEDATKKRVEMLAKINPMLKTLKTKADADPQLFSELNQTMDDQPQKFAQAVDHAIQSAGDEHGTDQLTNLVTDDAIHQRAEGWLKPMGMNGGVIESILEAILHFINDPKKSFSAIGNDTMNGISTVLHFVSPEAATALDGLRGTQSDPNGGVSSCKFAVSGQLLEGQEAHANNGTQITLNNADKINADTLTELKREVGTNGEVLTTTNNTIVINSTNKNFSALKLA